MRAGQAKLFDELLPKVSLPQTGDALTAEALFGVAKELWVEIGFGGGEHLAWQAEKNPDIGFIGCEPFLNGIAKALMHIQGKGLSNIRLTVGDARDVLDRLPAKSVSRIFLLFPDPWPKKRHHKRRFVCPETLGQMSRILVPGGIVRIATDIPDYCRWTLRHILARNDFMWTAECAHDWRHRSTDWPETRYESKAKKAGRRCAYLTFRRISPD